MQPLVDAWRAANPNIVAFWSALDRAVRTVIRKKTSARVGKVTLYWQDDKEKSTEKIDGAVALVMALDRAMKNQSGCDSVYNNRGLLLL